MRKKKKLKKSEDESQLSTDTSRHLWQMIRERSSQRRSKARVIKRRASSLKQINLTKN